MKRNLNSLYDLLRADGSIVINKNLIFAIGNNESIIYCELLSKYSYFNIREELTEDGFFFNTVDDLYLSTGLNEKPQRSSIKKLKEIELIDYKVMGMPPKRYFKITDDADTILELLEKGKKCREELEQKLLLATRKSKLRLLGGNKTSAKEEMIVPIRSVNNTKLNNTKLNNTKERYIELSFEDYSYIQIFKEAFTNRFDKLHKSVTVNNLMLVKQWCKDLANEEIGYDVFKEIVEEYLDELETDTKGNILYFMSISMRMLGVEPPTIAI